MKTAAAADPVLLFSRGDAARVLFVLFVAAAGFSRRAASAIAHAAAQFSCAGFRSSA